MAYKWPAGFVRSASVPFPYGVPIKALDKQPIQEVAKKVDEEGSETTSDGEGEEEHEEEDEEHLSSLNRSVSWGFNTQGKPSEVIPIIILHSVIEAHT